MLFFDTYIMNTKIVSSKVEHKTILRGIANLIQTLLEHYNQAIVSTIINLDSHYPALGLWLCIYPSEKLLYKVLRAAPPQHIPYLLNFSSALNFDFLSCCLREAKTEMLRDIATHYVFKEYCKNNSSQAMELLDYILSYANPKDIYKIVEEHRKFSTNSALQAISRCSPRDVTQILEKLRKAGIHSSEIESIALSRVGYDHDYQKLYPLLDLEYESAGLHIIQNIEPQHIVDFCKSLFSVSYGSYRSFFFKHTKLVDIDEDTPLGPPRIFQMLSKAVSSAAHYRKYLIGGDQSLITSILQVFPVEIKHIIQEYLRGFQMRFPKHEFWEIALARCPKYSFTELIELLPKPLTPKFFKLIGEKGSEDILSKIFYENKNLHSSESNLSFLQRCNKGDVAKIFSQIENPSDTEADIAIIRTSNSSIYQIYKLIKEPTDFHIIETLKRADLFEAKILAQSLALPHSVEVQSIISSRKLLG